MQKQNEKTKINFFAKSNKQLYFLYVILGIIIFVIGHVTAIVIYDRDVESFGRVIGIERQETLSENDFGFLLEIYGYLDQYHLDQNMPEKEKFINAAAKGFVSALEDEYTNYYSAEDWKEIQEQNSGQYKGIGIQLTKSDDYIVVETPLNNSPAQKVGIRALDIILEVDGEKINNMSITKIAEKIRGDEGTKVLIKVFRPSVQKKLDFEIVREEFDLPSVEIKEIKDLQEKKGYQIIVSKFTESDMNEFTSQWDMAVETVVQNNAQYVVLDLRNNVGGWVSAAKYVLSEFLSEGSIAYQEVNKNGEKYIEKITKTGKLENIPLVVLVNEGSASSSEITAGALQDLNRAKIVGESTVGKGVEQTIQSVSNGGKLFIVFKKWLTPNGRSLSEEGALQPDYQVENDAEDIMTGKDPQLEKAIEVVL